MIIFKAIDYATYTLPELRQLAALLTTTVIPDKERANKQEGLTKVREVMEQYSLTLHDLHPAGKAQQDKPKTTVPMLYANPFDAMQQWSGRGRAPKWMEAHLAIPGNTRNDLLIAGATNKAA